MSRSALDLIDRIGRIEVRPFLAPIPDAGCVVVATLQNGIQFNYQVVREPGWWVLHCDQSTVRRFEAPGSMFEIVQFLNALPRFLVIAVHRLRADTWLAIPWNTSDATQRGWPHSEPKPVHLVRDAIRPFDIIVARRLRQTLLYDTLDEGLGTSAISEAMRRRFDSGDAAAIIAGTPPEMEAVQTLLADYESEMRRRTLERAEAEERNSLGGRLRWHLAFVGAELLGWHEAGEGYEVRWRHDAHEYTMLLRRDLQIQSAGICLDGTDQSHNLSTIVGVMEEARKRGRQNDDDW
jgi:hypothetical protein